MTPTIGASMLAALGNVVPTALMDKRLTVSPGAPIEAEPRSETAAQVLPVARLLRRQA